MCSSLQVAWMNFHVSGPSRGFRSPGPPQCHGMNMFVQRCFNHSFCMLYYYSLNRYSPFHLLGLIIEYFSLKRPLKEGLHFPLLTQVCASVCRQRRHCFSMNWWDCGLKAEESEECVCLWRACIFLTGAGAGAVKSISMAWALPVSTEALLIQRRCSVAPTAQARLQHNTSANSIYLRQFLTKVRLFALTWKQFLNFWLTK